MTKQIIPIDLESSKPLKNGYSVKTVLDGAIEMTEKFQTKQYNLDPFVELMHKEFEVSDPNILGKDPNLQITWPIRLMSIGNARKRLVYALLLILNIPHIQKYLLEKDTKALQQCLDALKIL